MPARSPRPPRDLRLARLPLLLAYLLVLLGTPVGEAGFLWMHLTTAHSSPAKAGAEQAHSGGMRLDEAETLPTSALEHEHGPPPAHEHAAEHAHGHATPSAHAHAVAHEQEHVSSTEHHERVASTEAEPEPLSVTLDEPHEHGGRIHTHQQHPVPDAELLIDTLSKFYLAPPTTPAPSQAADAHHASQIPPAPHQTAARIDTPPPRLPV